MTHHIHPEAVDALFQPPVHHVVDLVAERVVLPVQVGLLLQESMEVVLVGGLVVFPGGFSAEAESIHALVVRRVVGGVNEGHRRRVIEGLIELAIEGVGGGVIEGVIERTLTRRNRASSY